MKSWLAAMILALCAPFARAELPLEAYGKLPAIETIQISPDGKRLAVIVTNGDARFVAVSEIDSKKQLLRIPAGTTKVSSVQWAGPDHVIVAVQHDIAVPGLTGGMQAWTVASDVDLTQGRMHPLIDIDQDTSRNGYNMNIVGGRPQIRTVDGRVQVFVEGIHFDAGYGRLSLFKYTPSTAASVLVRPGVQGTDGWLVGEDGEPLAQAQYDESLRRWTLRNRMSGGLNPAVVLTASIERPRIVGLGRDGHSTLLAVLQEEANGGRRTDVVELQPNAAAWGPPVMEEEEHRAIFDPNTDRLIGVSKLEEDDWSYTFFDPTDQKRWNALVKAYPGSIVKLESLSGDHQRWVVEVDSPTEGPAFAMVDFSTGKGQWLGFNYVDASKSLGEKKPIAFKAADGLALTAYLTLPKGREPKALPLVVLPHGGPTARSGPGFDWWAQAMASRGYAVLQVNYRGSGELGWPLLSAGFGQWGRKMQTDLSDGVRYLAAQGVIDPKRVCIVGSGYGGYAALQGAVTEPGVYRCAASIGGVSDLRRIVRWDYEEGGGPMQRFDLRLIGVDKLGDPKLDEISPLRQADKVAVPILLIHGKNDTLVDFSQSQLMYDALKRDGKDVQFVALPREDHWLLTGATRLQMLQATMDFLQKNNPPG